MQDRSVKNIQQTGRYDYKNPYEAEYYFVEGMGFLPSDPRAYEKRRLRHSGNVLGVCLMLYFFVSAFWAPALTIPLLRFLELGLLGPGEVSQRIYQMAAYSLSMILPFLIYKLAVGIPYPVAFPLKKPGGSLLGGAVWIVLACSVMGMILSYAVSAELSFLGGRPYSSIAEPTLSLLPLILHFVYVCVLAPVLEETVFRGLVLQSLRPYGDGFALLVSSVIFGAIHLSPLQQPSAFLLGLAIGYFTLVTDSLVTGMVLHAVVNLSSCVLMVLERCLPAQMRDGVFCGIYMLFLLCGLIAGIRYIRRAGQEAFRLRGRETYLSQRDKSKVFYSAPCMVAALLLILIYTLRFSF